MGTSSASITGGTIGEEGAKALFLVLNGLTCKWRELQISGWNLQIGNSENAAIVTIIAQSCDIETASQYHYWGERNGYVLEKVGSLSAERQMFLHWSLRPELG